MPDPAAALRECRRVLVSGGRLVFAVFTGPDENPFAALPSRVLADAGHIPPPTSGWQPGILALGDRNRIQALLDSAGLTATRLEGVDMTWTFTDAGDYWRFLLDLTALGPLIRSLPDPARDAVRGAIEARLVPFTHAGGIGLPSRCWCGMVRRSPA